MNANAKTSAPYARLLEKPTIYLDIVDPSGRFVCVIGEVVSALDRKGHPIDLADFRQAKRKNRVSWITTKRGWQTTDYDFCRLTWELSRWPRFCVRVTDDETKLAPTQRPYSGDPARALRLATATGLWMPPEKLTLKKVLRGLAEIYFPGVS